MSLKQLFEKYRDVIPYLFFGVCTTAVNVVVYWVCAHTFGLNTMISTITAWVLAVLFAYITNRKWVFRSEVHSSKEIIKEICSFFGCRIVTGVIDWGCMFFFVTLIGFNDVIVKFLANVIVIILNYMASKLIIFQKSEIYEKASMRKINKRNR